jgi:membrane protein YdbS with pleckstrin-like domain
MPEKIICPKCGKSTPDARFCKHCGEPMHSCIACGAKISGDSRFCTECGIELAPDQACALTEAVPKAYARYGPSLIPKDLLIEGEEPIFETRPVLWLSLMPPIAFIIVGVGILVSIYLRFTVMGILYGCGGIAFLGIVWALMGWLRWRYTIFGATSRRVLRQMGIVSKTYTDCPLYAVQNVYLDISVWGRINGFGTVRISGAGIQIAWENIDDPKEAHRILSEIVEQYRRQKI